MDTHERLAAYLSGDLDADEEARVEAELARDPDLRRRLAAIRRADRGLHELPAEPPRHGFEERLSAAVRGELDEQLGSGDDELAARRRGPQRAAGAMPAWASRLAAAAAVVAVLGGVGVVVTSSLGGGADTAEQAADAGAEAARPTAAAGEEATGAAGDGRMEALGAPAGPTVTASDRSYDESAATALTRDPRFQPLAGRQLEGTSADRLAQRYADRLARPDASGPPAADDGAATAGDVTAADRAAVRRCLPELLNSATAPVVPVFAEVARFRGEPAVIYGLLSPDPDTGALTRREVWVLGREACTVRHFAQAAATPG